MTNLFQQNFDSVKTVNDNEMREPEPSKRLFEMAHLELVSALTSS